MANRREKRNFHNNLSGVIGKSLTRLPVGLKTVLAIVAATPVMLI